MEYSQRVQEYLAWIDADVNESGVLTQKRLTEMDRLWWQMSDEEQELVEEFLSK